MNGLPKVLETLIYGFGNVHFPFESMKSLDPITIRNHHQTLVELKQAWGPFAWSPSLCNLLIWFPLTRARPFLELAYSATTRMTPSKKRYVERYRNRLGLVPIFPGSKQYPTSRCRFYPEHHTNDRYFR